jgi:hypothetical protein
MMPAQPCFVFSACTAFNGALAKYSNAFSLIVPGISDAGYLVRIHPRGQIEYRAE